MPQLDRDDIIKRFTHHVPATEQVCETHDAVREGFKEFALALLPSLPDGREKSLAATALEEASFWAHAAIAREGK